jgi:hypothetical protein
MALALSLGLLCGMWLIGQIAGAIYWTLAGKLWVALGSMFIPMFGIITLINALVAG